MLSQDRRPSMGTSSHQFGYIEVLKVVGPLIVSWCMKAFGNVGGCKRFRATARKCRLQARRNVITKLPLPLPSHAPANQG